MNPKPNWQAYWAVLHGLDALELGDPCGEEEVAIDRARDLIGQSLQTLSETGKDVWRYIVRNNRSSEKQRKSLAIAVAIALADE